MSLFIIPFLKKKGDFYRLPVPLSTKGRPYVQANIENKNYTLLLDTGASNCLDIKKETLNKINKKEITGSTSWYDFKGNKYTSNTFSIEEVRIGNTVISKAPTREESLDFLLYGSKLDPNQKTEIDARDGSVGAPFFRAYTYVLLDLPHESLVSIRDMDKIRTLPEFSFEGFTEVPLENHTPHIVISVDTDLGKKQFLIDTGTTHSLLRLTPDIPFSNLEWMTLDHFKIGECDFGKIQLCLCEITPKMDFLDGILGMDFLRKHQIYFDFEAKKAWIGPAIEPVSDAAHNSESRFLIDPRRFFTSEPSLELAAAGLD